MPNSTVSAVAVCLLAVGTSLMMTLIAVQRWYATHDEATPQSPMGRRDFVPIQDDHTGPTFPPRVFIGRTTSGRFDATPLGTLPPLRPLSNRFITGRTVISRPIGASQGGLLPLYLSSNPPSFSVGGRGRSSFPLDSSHDNTI